MLCCRESRAGSQPSGTTNIPARNEETSMANIQYEHPEIESLDRDGIVAIQRQS
jgi:hypothetical protein